MKRFAAVATLAVMGFSSAVAFADPVRVEVADGAVSFAVPSGWVQDTEPGFAIYIEPTLEDKDWSRCAVKTGKGPNPQNLSQEAFNARLAQRTARTVVGPSDELISFSNTGFVGDARLFAFSYVSEKGPAFNVRQFSIVDGNTIIVIHADCVTADPEAADAEFLKGAVEFLEFAIVSSH